MADTLQKLEKIGDHLVDPEVAIKLFFENAADAIVVVGADGLIKLVNHTAEMMFGYHRSAMFDKPITMLMPESYRERHDEHFKNYLRSPRIRPMGTGLILKGRKSDGEEFPIEINLSPTMEKGGLLIAAAIRRRDGPATG
jgi:PAS domain S-box-containing protein